MVEEALQSTLAGLRPAGDRMVMDLVRDAGVDVTPWARKKDGSPVTRPQANPAYCYEWSFGGEGEPTVLCVWHSHLKVRDGGICYEGNLRELASRLEGETFKSANPQEVKSRAKSQAARARSFDLALQRALRKQTPCRIILLIGDDSGATNVGWDTSKVQYRSLDAEPWVIAQYDMNTGHFTLVRGAHAPTSASGYEPFVDQFSVPQPAGRVDVERVVFERSAEVRRRVLQRSEGECEYCRQPGFRMANGQVYLETHHVIPLAESGPDVEWNVLAICPNDHRRAHFAAEREQMRSEMIDILVSLEPKACDALSTVVNSVRAGRGE